MVRLGTCASRSPRSSTASLSSASAVNAVTATGTSCRVSSRLRAETVTVPSVVARACGSAGAASASCAHAAGAANADDSTMPPIATLRYLRFIASPPAGTVPGWRRYGLPCRDANASGPCHASTQARDRRRRAASYLRTMGRGTAACGHSRLAQGPATAMERVDVLRDRAGGAVLPDVRRLPRPQRDPVRAGGGAGRGAADRPVAGRADVHRLVHGQDGGLPQALLPGVPARRDLR